MVYYIQSPMLANKLMVICTNETKKMTILRKVHNRMYY
jgi:hypothetical protein